MKRLKSVTAGLLHYDYLVPMTVAPGPPKGRRPRLNISTAAQVFMNLKNSWRQCELMIAANFGTGDYVLTLTYDDEHLPASKAEADKLYQKFVRKLRGVRRRRGQELRYIYATEGFHGQMPNGCFMDDSEWEDHRLHHHIVLNGCQDNDLEEIRSLWPYGVYVRLERLDIHYYEELAKYLTKEAREFGRAKVGERAWKGSRNLVSFVVEYDDVKDNMSLVAPEGAVDYRYIDKPNPEGYGQLICTRYLILPVEEPPQYSYNLGRRRTG